MMDLSDLVSIRETIKISLYNVYNSHYTWNNTENVIHGSIIMRMCIINSKSCVCVNAWENKLT